MNLFFKPIVAVSTIFMGLAVLDYSVSEPKPSSKAPGPRIQAAILLDVSGSMDGLIEQAKAQLWNMVSTMGKAQCDAGAPKIEIALYEYGRSSNDQKQGYIRQISPFTSDLDQLSQELFKLSTNGGEEYCNHVIYTSLQELNWDQDKSSYKTIFIAGNEDFLQGSITWMQACQEAKKKNVIVNTIYCGDKELGKREHWDLTGECGNGSYTNIDQNSQLETIPTPYDSTLIVLNNKLNSTYIGYGSLGRSNYTKQASVDKMNFGLTSGVAMQRIAVKGNKQLYANEGWDLVDAAEKDSSVIYKVELKTLPDSLQKVSREQLRQLVEVKANERSGIQSEIAAVNSQREAYLVKERKRIATSNTQNLESAIEVIIKEQVKRFNMRID